MANTYTWFGGSGPGNVGTNWVPSGPPEPGDTAIVNAGTVMLTDGSLTDNLLDLNAGTFALTNNESSFFSGGSTIVSGFDNATTLLGGTNGAAALDVFGDFVNEGTIEAVGHTLTVAISAYVTTGVSLAGTLLNEGLFSVQDGAALDVTGGAGQDFQGGDVDLKGASAVITAADPDSNYTLDNTSTLALHSAGTNVSVNFFGTADMLALNSTALDSTINIDGFGSGDTLDIGPNDIGTLVYEQYAGNGFGGSSSPILTIIGTNGGTLLSDPFSATNGGFVGNTSGTFTPFTLASGTVELGPFEVVTAGNGDTLLELLPPSTWQWTNADPSNINSPSNWALVSGPGNQQGSPNSGDTVFANNVTLAFPSNNYVSGNTIYLTGTSEMSFVGTQAVTDGSNIGGQKGISYQNPTIDDASIISNDPLPPATTTLDFAGYNVAEGTLISNGGPGSSLTINVTQDGTNPGYFFNYGEIEAAPHNTVTIAVAGTSEVFNAGLIYANGGTVVMDASSAGIAGGYAPMLGGVALIGDGGTIEYNAGFPSGTAGSNPLFAFYDSDAGDTLMLLQPGQFGGRILGFQQGDTIDLGNLLGIGTIAVTTDGRVLLENNRGAVLDTLVLSSGAYTPGTFAVSGSTAGGFTLTTGTDGDTLLTTGVVNSVWNNTTGVWQTAGDWSTTAVPGASATAVIGVNASGSADQTIAPFTLSTSAEGTGTAVTVNSLIEGSSNATLLVDSDTTVGTNTGKYGIQQIAGSIEVQGGYTLTTTFLRQDTSGADLQIDAGAVFALTGHSNLGFANNGSLTESTVVNGTAIANGNTEALFVMGTATVDGGEIDAGPVFSGPSLVSTGGYITVGENGGGTPSTMTVENGGTVIDTYAILSSDPTSFGALTLTGGAVWDDVGDPTDALNTRGYMDVGNDNQSGNQPSPAPAGTAQLVVEDDSVLNEALYAIVGNSVDSAGSATIASGGVWNVGTSAAGAFMLVGNHGSGTLVVGVDGTLNILAGTGTYTSNGTLNTTGQGFGIAHNVGSDGTVVVDGGLLSIAINNTITSSGLGIGQYGQGVLDIYDGGTVSIVGGGFSAGSDGVTGSGTIIVGAGDGQSALLQVTSPADPNAGGANIGKVGSGTLVVNSDGTVDVGAGSFNVGSTAGATGTVVVNGGLVEDTVSGMNVGNSGTGTVYVTAGGTLKASVNAIDIGRQIGSYGLLEINSGLIDNTSAGMNVGDSGTGTLLMTGGTIQLNGGFNIGESLGANGFAEISGGLLDDNGGMAVGNVATGTLEIVNSGTVLLNGSGTNVGTDADAPGLLEIASGGLLTSTTNGMNVGLNTGAVGTLEVLAGGTYNISAHGMGVGIGTGATGTVLVDGTGALISLTAAATGIGIGESGAGYLTVESNGTLSDAGGGIEVGQNAGGTGTVVVTTGGRLTTSGAAGLIVGNAGSGLLTIGAGATAAGGNSFYIAQVGTASSGTVVVNGGTLNDSGIFGVGDAGAGTLVVENNGLVDQTGINFNIGSGGGSSGTVVVNHGTLDAQGNFQVGGSGSGTLLVDTLSVVNDGTGVVSIGAQSGGTGTVAVNGGTLLGAGLSVGGFGDGTLTVNGGGQVVLSGGTINGIGIGSGFGGTGEGLVVINSGTVSTTGSGVSVGGTNESGALVIDAGGLLIATGTAGIFGVSQAGQINASGIGLAVATVDGGTWIANGGVAVGGSGNGWLNISGSLSTAGLVNAGTNTVSIGAASGGDGTVTVGSGGTLLAGNVSIANLLTGTASGILTIATGGTVETGSLTEGTSGTVVVNGTLGVTGSQGVAIGQSGNGPSEAVVNTGGTVTDAGFLTVGASGVGALDIFGGTFKLVGGNAFVAGLNSGGNGAVTVDGGVLNAGSSYISLGNSTGSTGELTIEGGGTLSGAGIAVGSGLSSSASGTGAITVSGSGSRLSAAGQLNVGSVGTGSLLVENQATALTGSGTLVVGFSVGTQTGASGAATVTGTGSLLDNTGEMIVGDAGSGSLSIESGGTVITAPATLVVPAAAVIADTAGASGSSVDVSGAGSDWQVNGSLIVGDAGYGSLSLSQGGSASAGNLTLGAAAGGDGVISVVGTGTALDLTGDATVGSAAAGELSILAGASASVAGLTIGTANAASSGNVDVEGAGSTLFIDTGGFLNIGVVGGGSGELTIGKGTTLNFAGSISENGHASFNNNGGTVDPDAIEYTTPDNSGNGLNEYSLYVGNINAVQISAGDGIWNTPMVLTGTSVADAQNNIDNNSDVGEWQLSQGGTLVLNANTIDAGQAIVFEDATDTLVIGQVVNGGSAGVSGVDPTVAPGAENLFQAGGFEATIWGYQAGDRILFDNMFVASDTIVGGNTLEVFISGDATPEFLTFFNKTGNRPLGLTGMEAAAAEILADNAPCFAAGTRIATERGEVAVEGVGVGERVRVLLGGGESEGDAPLGDRWAEVIWVGRREVDCSGHKQPKKVWPVRVSAGAFGPGCPHADVWLSPDHAVYVGGVLIPVKYLVNGTTIAQVPRARVVYHHVELTTHNVLLAEGLPAESFLDMKDGSNYSNRPGPVRLYPDFTVRMWEAFGCARLVVTGPELVAARALVEGFARTQAAA